MRRRSTIPPCSVMKYGIVPAIHFPRQRPERALVPHGSSVSPATDQRRDLVHLEEMPSHRLDLDPTSSEPRPDMNLLAQQLRLSAIEAEVSRFQRLARDAPIGILFIAAATPPCSSRTTSTCASSVARERVRGRAVPARCPAGRPSGCAPSWERDTRASTSEGDGTRVPVLVGLSTQQDGVAAFVIDLTSEKAAERARQGARSATAPSPSSSRKRIGARTSSSGSCRTSPQPARADPERAPPPREAPDDGARTARAREVINRQFRHLSRLVDDLLDLTRITRGHIQLRRECLDLARVARETVEDHRAGFEAVGVTLALQPPPAPIPVDGDETRIAQIVGNLLANSAKFTPRGGTVTVRRRGGARGRRAPRRPRHRGGNRVGRASAHLRAVLAGGPQPRALPRRPRPRPRPREAPRRAARRSGDRLERRPGRRERR